MKVQYLDLATGRKAVDCGLDIFSLTEGNWSCDCNRAIPFGDSDCTGVCRCNRYVMIGIEAESGDGQFNEADVIERANREYYMKLKSL